MLRLKFWIGGALVALMVSGIAMAAAGAKTDTPSATFSATAKRVQTKTCQGSDGTYKITKGVYEGKMDSTDPRLAGPVRLKIESVYNTDESAGWMRGELKLRNGDTDMRAEAQLSAVNLDGTVEGLLTGHAGTPRAKLLANFVADFTPDGFANGKLGTGGSANQSLFFGGACVRDDAAKKGNDAKKPEGDKKRPDTTERPSKDTAPTRP
jgi:hypothetical protein